MADMMGVTATATLPEWFANNIFAPGFDLEALQRARVLGGEIDSVDEEDAYYDDLDAIRFWFTYAADSHGQFTVTGDGRTITVDGTFGYGLAGFQDTLSWSSVLESLGIPYEMSDDGGKYETGTRVVWAPETGEVATPADRAGDTTLSASAYSKINDIGGNAMSDAELGVWVREYFSH